MKILSCVGPIAVYAVSATALAAAEGVNANAPTASLMEAPAGNSSQNWNFHVQNTDIVQGYPGFSSKYSGPNSLPNGGQTRETVSLVMCLIKDFTKA